MSRAHQRHSQGGLDDPVVQQDHAFLRVLGREKPHAQLESHEIAVQSRHGERFSLGSTGPRAQFHPVDRERHVCRHAGSAVVGPAGQRADKDIGEDVAEHHAAAPGRFREPRRGRVDGGVPAVREPRRVEHRAQRATGARRLGLRAQAPGVGRLAHQSHRDAGYARAATRLVGAQRERDQSGEQRRPGRVPAAASAQHQRQPHRRGRGRRVRPALSADRVGPVGQPVGRGAEKSAGRSADVGPVGQPDPEPRGGRLCGLRAAEGVELARQRRAARAGPGVRTAAVPGRVGPVGQPDRDDHEGNAHGPGPVESAEAGRAD